MIVWKQKTLCIERLADQPKQEQHLEISSRRRDTISVTKDRRGGLVAFLNIHSSRNFDDRDCDLRGKIPRKLARLLLDDVPVSYNVLGRLLD